MAGAGEYVLFLCWSGGGRGRIDSSSINSELSILCLFCNEWLELESTSNSLFGVVVEVEELIYHSGFELKTYLQGHLVHSPAKSDEQSWKTSLSSNKKCGGYFNGFVRNGFNLKKQ